MSSHAPAHWKPDRTIAQEHQCTMDHMPVPAGSWQEQYDKTNGKYNIFLAVAVVFFTVTIYVVSNLVIIFICIESRGLLTSKNIHITVQLVAKPLYECVCL